MHLLITGANGLIGKALTRRLLSAWAGLDKLTLIGLRLDLLPYSRVRALTGDLSDSALRTLAFSEPVDVVFHLASVPRGTSERDPSWGIG